METLELQSAELRYHQVGRGPVPIFIFGANGTGDIFLPLTGQLKDHFTVVAADRRDYGEGELTEPLPDSASSPDSDYRVRRDTQDIAELVKLLSDKPVYILGSNSGPIVAIRVLKDYLEVVKKITFHEPLINTFLPDSIYWKDKNDDIVYQTLTEGLEKGMKTFGETLNIAPIDARIMSRSAGIEEGRIKQYKCTMFWSESEIRQYTHSDTTLDGFTKYNNKITLLSGTDSRGSFPQNVNFCVNKETGIPTVDIPGGHLGYIQRPKDFADVLLNMQG